MKWCNVRRREGEKKRKTEENRNREYNYKKDLGNCHPMSVLRDNRDLWTTYKGFVFL